MEIDEMPIFKIVKYECLVCWFYNKAQQRALQVKIPLIFSNWLDNIDKTALPWAMCSLLFSFIQLKDF